MSNDINLKYLTHCTYKLTYHLILITTYRKRCISDPMRIRIGEIFEDLLKKWECFLLEFNGEADHVHMLIELNPRIQPSSLIRNLKSVSSRIIRDEFCEELKNIYWKPVFWSKTYCLLTCGGAPLNIIKKYIENHS